MVKKAQTKPTKQDAIIQELHARIELSNSAAELMKKQRDQARKACEMAEDRHAKAVDALIQTDTLCKHKDNTFFAMVALVEDANIECKELTEELDCANRKTKCFKYGFYAMLTINFTVAILHLFH